jgi:hypothetical protein
MTDISPSALAAEVSGPLLMDHCRALSRWVKLSGTDDEAESLRYFRARLDEYGYRTRIILHDAYISLPGKARVLVDGMALTAITHSMSRSSPAGGLSAELVYIGQGSAADFAGKDLKGKIVLAEGIATPVVAALARDAGAVGIIAIGNAGVWGDGPGTAPSLTLGDSLLDDARGQRLGGAANPALMPRLFAGSGLVWDSVAARARRGDALPTGMLTTSLKATLPTIRRTLTSPNVVGILPGTDPVLRHEVVVYTAHSDHVGTFKGPVLTGDSIFNGAMDNASGAATLMETARLVAQRGGNKRTLAFVAVTAEEKGLLGSRWFAAHPSLGTAAVVANLNTDMFLPLIPLKGVFAYGYEESDLADDLDAVVKARGIAVLPDPEPQENRFVRSDQYSFIRQGIPALAFKVGYTPGTPEEKTWLAWVRDHYHKLSDDITQPVNFETAAQFNALYADLAIRVANRATRPQWRASSFFARQLVP